MAIALVAHTAIASPNGNTVTTSGVDTTGANFVVALTGIENTSTNTPPTDNKGNTFTGLTAQGGTGDGTARLWYCLDAVVGSGHTMTQGPNSKAPGIAWAAFSGVAIASAFDVQNGASSVSPPGQPGSITPNQNDSLIITGIAAFPNTSPSINGGFTIADWVAAAGGQSYGAGLAYLIQTTAAAANPTWSNYNFASGLVIAAFKPSVGGGIVIPVFTNQYRQRRA